jgi:multiple PDZ domain protein
LKISNQCVVVVVVQVDGIVLSGFTNQQAVEILKQTGQVVKLRITRYLRGLKFQELQEGIAQANAETPNTNSPYLLTPNDSKMTGFDNQVRNYL